MESENSVLIPDTDHIDPRGDDEDLTRQSKFRVTMELPLFLTMLGISVSAAPTSNLIMFRTCLHPLNHSMEECGSFLLPESINHTQELENEVQHYAAFVTTARTVLQATVPALMSVIIGVWSDKHGRKPLILWSVLGIFVSSLMTVIYSMLPSLGPWWFVGTVTPYFLSGGFPVLNIGCMCYVTDISTVKSRTTRILYVQLAISVASAVGSSISPYLLKGLGNLTYLLLIETSFYAIAFAYSAIFLQESLRTATPGTFGSIFSVAHLKEMVKVCFTKKPDNGRAIILIIVTSSSLFFFAVYGPAGIQYLYTRNKIHWTMKDYTTYKSISTAMWFVGSIFAVRVLQRVFRISDISFAVVSYMSCMIEYLIKGFATRTWHMYLGSAVSLFGTTSGTFTRSFLTKILPATEIAKVFALLGAGDAISPILSPVIYNMLYAYTIDTLPGAFLLLSFAVTSVCFVLTTVILCLRRTPSSSTYEVIEEQAVQNEN